MKHTIACRPGCLGLPLADALAVLKSEGIDNVEPNAPEDNDYDRLARMAVEAGVNITSLSAGAKVDDPEQVAAIERVIVGAARIGTRIIFLAASLKEAPYEAGIDVLKGLAKQAHQAGVILSLETHLPFAHNGEIARKTVEAVDSPGLGFNYDTANIYYYNPKGIDTVEELKKALPQVTSVHLKESAKGEPKKFDFPVFGEGIVDFPEVFRILDDRGYTGPYTMELEGPLVAGLPVKERTEKVRGCVDYLKKIGVMA